ncbi:uncharacterized protein LOC143025807 [Oratosquilla oratoria]|uniref:uncharacterized protein LOC143025807 n=1 Tax=Oratosquilla oratoria TaxID=337810 RepID=UPI003F75C0B1
MPKEAELSISLRNRIKALRDAGWTLQKIAIDIKCSPNTVKYTLDREKVTGDFKARERNGRSRKLSNRAVRFLFKKPEGQEKTACNLMDECNKCLPEKEVSRSTVSRRLRKNGKHGRVAVRITLLRKSNIVKRLEFAKHTRTG